MGQVCQGGLAAASLDATIWPDRGLGEGGGDSAVVGGFSGGEVVGEHRELQWAMAHHWRECRGIAMRPGVGITSSS